MSRTLEVAAGKFRTATVRGCFYQGSTCSAHSHLCQSTRSTRCRTAGSLLINSCASSTGIALKITMPVTSSGVSVGPAAPNLPCCRSCSM